MKIYTTFLFEWVQLILRQWSIRRKSTLLKVIRFLLVYNGLRRVMRVLSSSPIFYRIRLYWIELLVFVELMVHLTRTQLIFKVCWVIIFRKYFQQTLWRIQSLMLGIIAWKWCLIIFPFATRIDWTRILRRRRFSMLWLQWKVASL